MDPLDWTLNHMDNGTRRVAFAQFELWNSWLDFIHEQELSRPTLSPNKLQEWDWNQLIAKQLRRVGRA